MWDVNAWITILTFHPHFQILLSMHGILYRSTIGVCAWSIVSDSLFANDVFM